MASTNRLARVMASSTRQLRHFCTEPSPSPSTATPMASTNRLAQVMGSSTRQLCHFCTEASPLPSTTAPSRLARVMASSTRQLRHFCTEPSPSTSTATPTQTATATTTVPTFKPPKRKSRKAMRKGRMMRRSEHGMWDSFELQQLDIFERNLDLFFQRKRSPKDIDKFFEEEYEKMERNEAKYPGEVTDT